MESNLSGSVIAKLMGFDEPPSQYPAMKKQRVLSEKYLQRIAAIGVRKNQSISGLHSVRCKSLDTKKTVTDAGYHLGNDIIDNSLELQESLGILNVNVDFCLDYFLKPQDLFMKKKLQNDPFYSGEDAARFRFHSGIGKPSVVNSKSGSLTEGKNVHSLQTFHDEIQRSVHENSGPRGRSRFSRTKQDPKDGLFRASRFSASNSHSGKSENSIRSFFSPCSREATNKVPSVNNCFPSLDCISTEASKTNKLGSQMNAVSQSSSISEISQKSHEWQEAYNISRKVQSSELRVDRQPERSESLSTTYGKRKYSLSPSTSIDGLKTGEANKTISEGQKVAENCEVGLVGQSITHGEFMTRLHNKHGQTKLNYDVTHIRRCKRDSSVPEVNLSAMHRDDSKVRQVRKAASFTSNNSFRTKNKDGHSDDEFGSKLGNSSIWSSYKSDNKSSNWKHFPPVRTFRSGPLGSSPVLGAEANTCSQKVILKRCCKDDISDVSLYMKKREIIITELGDDVMLHDIASSAKTEVLNLNSGNKQEMQYKITPIDLCSEVYVCPVSDSSVQQETLSDAGSVYSSCLDSEPDSLLSFQEACYSSPISVLDSTFGNVKYSCSGCFEANIDYPYASESDSQEPEMNVSSDEESGEETGDDSEDNDKFFRPFKVEESRDFSYLLEVLNESGFYKWNLLTITCKWHSPECPISPLVFEVLEKKFGQQTSWMRSDRKLIFDRINLGLMEIIQPSLGVPTWKMPVVRRLNPQGSHEAIEKELWAMLSVPAKETSNNTEELFACEFRTDLGEDIDTIARDIVECIVDELADEIF